MKEFDKGLDCLDEGQFVEAAGYFDKCINAKYIVPASLYYQALANINCATTGKLLPKFLRWRMLSLAIKKLEEADRLKYDMWEIAYALGWAHFAFDYLKPSGGHGGMSNEFMQYNEMLESNHPEMCEKMFAKIRKFRRNFE
jgi:hypothetical protein